MGINQTFSNFLNNTSSEIDIFIFISDLILSAILAFILSIVYEKFGSVLSNRRAFGSNFVMITMTTMLIIAVVKSSLALSLGLVGALSIVRFRTAIKEPEELAYLFLCIGIGLSLGAGQRLISLSGFFIIIIIILIKNYRVAQKKTQNLHLTINSQIPEKIQLGLAVEILEKYCDSVLLKRFDENSKNNEAYFLIEIKDFQSLEALKNELQSLSEFIEINYLDNVGLVQ